MPQLDKSPERVRSMFGQIAPKYDFLNNWLSFGLARRWRRFLVAQVFKRLFKHWDVSNRIDTLDVATGTGDVIVEFRRRWNKRFKNKLGASTSSVGVDFAPEMLELAKKKIQKKNLTDVEFVEADGMNLPFPSERFDAVTIAFGLRNMVDPKQGVSELVRVCRPGGVVAILEFSPTKFPIFGPIFRFYFHKILPLIGRCVSKHKDAYRYLPQSVDDFESVDTILNYLREFGIEDARRYSLTLGVLGLFIGRKREV